jgi:hypothetical protein
MRGIFFLESSRKLSSLKNKIQPHWEDAMNGLKFSTIKEVANIGVVELARSGPVHLVGG